MAARQAISSPLLEITIDGAKGVLFNIIGGADMTMSEVDEAAKIIAAAADADAKIIFGATIDETMVDQIKITVIATGFDENRQKLKNLRYERPVANNKPEEIMQQEPQKVQPQNTGFDEFGEDFEIPAFLRKGK